MHIHILGICGTFMGSFARLAKALGHHVTGSDSNVYPPMSTQLEAAGIDLIEGFGLEQLKLKPDVFVIGNVITRGNPLMEEILDRGLPYTSGPDWLNKHLLQGKWVLAVAGTHGKTTTSTMLAWILEYAGFKPGFLIGGVPANFDTSARLGESDFFVIEADEYDTAFFDKRSKFLHYQPKTLVINNLEFDHADIFPDLAAIQRQFHHLIRTVPRLGQVIYPASSGAIQELISDGCWSDSSLLGKDWSVVEHCENGGAFEVFYREKFAGQVEWCLRGKHNQMNGLAAVAAAYHVGISPELSCEALCKFKGVKRRLELLGDVDGIKVYDDFAHHPTAIKTTLEGIRAAVGNTPVFAVLEPRSNTMKKGIFKDELSGAVAAANKSFWYQANSLSWDLESTLDCQTAIVCDDIEKMIDHIVAEVSGLGEAHVVVMSNGGFEGIHARIVDRLKGRS